MVFFDDIFTGPIDEVIVIGLIAHWGAKWARDFAAELSKKTGIDSTRSSSRKIIIEEKLTDITEKYENGKCDVATKAMAKYLKKRVKDIKFGKYHLLMEMELFGVINMT